MGLGRLKNGVIIKYTIIILLCGFVGWFLRGRLIPAAPNMAMMGGGEPFVLTQEIERTNIDPQSKHIGHVEAIKSVDLRPQISGYIEKVLFQEGSHVKEGDILIVIEQQRYIANVELREAELASAKANLVKTERDYKRQQSLSKQNIASKATFDRAESDYLQAKSAVKQAEANLELAKIDLNYTEIKAPFDGNIGKALVTEGNYVSSNSVSLAKIVQVNPIRVAFSLTDKDYLNLRQMYRTDDETSNIHTQIILPNGQIYDNHFRSRFSDNEVNSETATIALYAEFGNEDNLLIPGNYVNILIGGKESVQALLVPQAAIAQDENGNYVMVVDDENMVSQRRVDLGEVVGTKQVVLKGLDMGEKVIIQGLQKVSDGIKVRATLIGKDGEIK